MPGEAVRSLPVTWFAFVVTLTLSQFGGEVEVTLKARTADGCWKLRRFAQTRLWDAGLKAHVTECEPR